MDLKNRFRNESSSDIDYSVNTIWNTTAKLLLLYLIRFVMLFRMFV
jgi:hypothetical protein